jgi:hypothetical protein
MTVSQFDLSALPPEQRAKWQSRLDALPPGVRETLQRNLSKVPADKVAKILQDSSPMLERVLGRVETPRPGGATQNQPPARAPVAKIARDDYFNTTVQQGDGGGVPLVPIVGIVAALALLLTWLFGS